MNSRRLRTTLEYVPNFISLFTGCRGFNQADTICSEGTYFSAYGKLAQLDKVGSVSTYDDGPVHLPQKLLLNPRHPKKAERR